MPKVFVIIVTYKGHLWYDRCFTSLRTSEIPVQTIVVDNASNDGTIEYIKLNFPEVHIISSDTNLGFGQGNNKGIRYALDNGADYVFLLNQDAWIESKTISELVRIHTENQNYGILSPVNVPANKDSILGGFINLLTDYRNVDAAWVSDLYFNKLKNVYDIKSVNAAAWLLPRTILETVGGFDPIFFHYGEDDNYLQRAFYHGFAVGICPKIIIVHNAEVSSKLNTHMKSDMYKRTILLTCCNINHKSNILSEVNKTLMKRLLFKILKVQVNKIILTYRERKFFISMKKSILASRKQNVLKQSNWL